MSIVIHFTPYQQYMYSPVEVVVNHGHHSVLNSHLVASHSLIHVLVQLLAQGLDDELRVGDFLTIQLNEGQKTTLGTEFAIVVHILKTNNIIYIEFWIWLWIDNYSWTKILQRRASMKMSSWNEKQIFYLEILNN